MTNTTLNTLLTFNASLGPHSIKRQYNLINTNTGEIEMTGTNTECYAFIEAHPTLTLKDLDPQPPKASHYAPKAPEAAPTHSLLFKGTPVASGSLHFLQAAVALQGGKPSDYTYKAL